MRETRRTRLQVVPLEGRALLSGPSTSAPAVAAQVAKPGAHRPIVLEGMTANTVVLIQSSVVQINGTGKLRRIGPVVLTSTSDARSQRPLLETPWLLHADIVLTGRAGSVFVRLTPGPIPANPFSMPVHLRYTVRGGTGAYRNATGTGMADLTLAPGEPALSQYNQLFNRLKHQGVRFTLSFHPGEPSRVGDFSAFWYKVIQTVVRS